MENKRRDTLAGALMEPLRLLILAAPLAAGCASIQTEMRKDVTALLEDRNPRREIERFTNNRNFLEALKEISELGLIDENIFLSEDPDAPVIIILGDRHGSPEIEESRLRILKDKLGVNFIGIEGWTQYMVNRVRTKNITIVKSSEINVSEMIESGFSIVGLEDPDLHNRMIEYQFAQIYIDGLLQFASVQYLEQSPDYSPETYSRAERSMNSYFDKLIPFLQYFGVDSKDASKNQDLRRKIFSKLGISIDDFKKKDGETYSQYKIRIERIQSIVHDKIGVFNNPLWIKDRNKVAARQMVEQIKINGIKRAVIVFGSFHSFGLAEELKSLGDFTIVYISPPDDDQLDEMLDILMGE